MHRLTLLLTIPTLFHAPVQAQDEAPPVPAADGAGEVARGKARPRSQAPASVPVTGIKAEALPEILANVKALTHPVYACPSCSLRGRKAGTCASCQVELEGGEPTGVVERVEASVDGRFLSVVLRPHTWGSLGEIDAALKKSGARVRRDALSLREGQRLLVSGLEPERSSSLRAAFVDLKVLPAASVHAHEDRAGAYWVLPRPGEKQVSVADIEAALARIEPQAKLEDVQWSVVCPACGKGAKGVGEVVCPVGAYGTK